MSAPRTVWPNGERVDWADLTGPQWAALERVRERWKLRDTVEITPGFGGSYIMVDVGPMLLGIEADGHTHS